LSLEQLLLLALIQGLTEFLPVSSSAHLILLPVLTGLEDQGVAIDIAVHVGSLGAVITYFRAEVARMIRAVPDLLKGNLTQDAKLLFFLVIATVPAVIFGAALAAFDLDEAMRDRRVIAWASIIFGIVLYVADRYSKSDGHLTQLTTGQVIGIGFAQALALIPGTSRSGITMTAGRAFGLQRTEAARFSMLLSIPIILASGLFASLDLIAQGGEGAALNATIAGAMAFLSALATIWIFLKVLDRIGFTPFILYRIALGIALLTLF
jgi:undecaprenyl-diphosphatase